MPLSLAETSETSVSGLLGERSPPRRSREPGRRAPADVRSWAERDSVQAAAACATSCSSPSEREADGAGAASAAAVLQLRLDVAAGQLSEAQSRVRSLEAEARELRGRMAAADGKDESSKLSQAVLLQRVQELEAALSSSKAAEQELAAQLARTEGRAAVAEGSRNTSQQQLEQGLAEQQAAHAKALAGARAEHARELAAAQQAAADAAASAQAAADAREAKLAAANAQLEGAVKREHARARELHAQLDKQGSKQEAVRELMRHSEALQAQLDRAQAAAQEERRRAGRAAAAGDAALQQERQLAEAAAQEGQLRAQEAAREHDKALRQVRAKLQRVETELRAAKQQATAAAARASELEGSNAQKDLQLDAAVQQVSLMQHELEALRQGLSGRQAAAMEAARAEYAAALAGCRADLEAAQQRASEQALAMQRQGKALSSILRILAVHAGAEEGDGAPGAPSAAKPAGAALDPDKVVAFVEAVSASMLDMQQAWQLEKGEMGAALEAAEAVHAQLESLLERERGENREMTAEAVELRGALGELEAQLEAAQEQLHELDAAKTARTAADSALEVCRSELAMAAAKAASAADDAAKWQGTASALEAQVQQLTAEAQAARQEACVAAEEAQAKEGRIAEMRSAMSSAMQERSSSAAQLSEQLGEAQAACSAACQPAVQHLQAALGALGGEGEPQGAALAKALQAVVELLQGLPPPQRDLAGCISMLGSIVSQLAAGYSHVAAMTQERHKVHHILCSVNARLQQAAAAHPSRLGAPAGTTNVNVSSSNSSIGSGPAAGSPAQAAAGSRGSGSSSLVDLLQQLTENVVGLIEGLAVEKECLESQMLHSTDEAQQLRSQLQSVQSVLASLQSHTAMEHREALVALEQARLRVAELESENAEVAERARQAHAAADAIRASATREWSSMRDDLSGLVQQAEQAQLNADAVCQRQQAEYEERLRHVQQQAAEAAAGRATAEAAAAELQRELAAARQELASAEQRLGAQDAALSGGLQASQAAVAALEAQVAQLQRQLSARLRGKGVSAAPAKKVAAASSAAGLLKQENQRLRLQVEGLQEQIRLLEVHVRQGVNQLRAAKELSATAERGIADAEGRATRAETLLRKVDERKAAAEVERRRASEAAARLEQQVLELQSRLEAAQHRERAAQSEVERLRSTCGKRDADARHLSAALSQLEVAEAALRDSQGTSSRLLQDCTNLQRENRQLKDQERRLGQQLQDAQQEAAAASDQVEDLQATLNSVITELDIARSCLANQRHQEQLVLDGREQGQQQQQGSMYHQQLVAFPVRIGSLRFNPEADPGERCALDQAMDVLAAQDTNVRGSNWVGGKGASGSAPGGIQPAAFCTPGAESSSLAADGQPSPLTQQLSMQRPGTPTAGGPQGANPGMAARLIDDGSSSWGPAPGHTEAAGCPAQLPAGTAGSRPGSGGPVSGPSRPDTAASSVDVGDVRRLVATVEGLQRQLSIKNERIKQMREALEAARANGASFTPAGSRPGSAAAAAAAASTGEAQVLQQRLQSAQQQAENLRALNANLERQLSDVATAQRQLLAAARQLAGVLGAGGSSSRPPSAGDSLPSTSGDSGAVLRLQAHQLQQLVAAAGEELERTRRDLSATQQQASTLTLQLGSRNALVDALQARLRAVSPSAGGSVAAGRSATEATQTDDGALLACPAPLAATSALSCGEGCGGAAADALGSLDRIVGLWRQACSTKDGRMHELREELEQAQDSLTRTRADLEAACAAAQQLAAEQQQSGCVIEELQQVLEAAEKQVADVREEAQLQAACCTELEVALMEAQAAAEADSSAAEEARAAAAEAQQQAHRLQQRLGIAEAQVRELQHLEHLERAAHSDVGTLRQQVSVLQADLSMAQQEAAAAQRQVGELQRRLREQEAATESAANGSATSLAARLDAARQAEQQLLRQAQDLQARFAAAEQQSEEGRRAAAVAEAQVRQLQERLAGSEQQHREALEAVEQQSSALEGLQAALDRMQLEQSCAAEASATQEQLARQLAATQQELAVAQQAAAVAQKQAEVCRVQAAKAEAEAARAAAERRHVANREAAVADALQRYQRGVSVLSSTLQQLQASGAGDGAEDLLLASLHAGVGSSGAGASGMAVEQLVDEILLQVHRRDCEISSLVAQLAHLEAALATKGRQAAESEAKKQQSQQSLGRLKEQLHWSSKEAEALKRQLGDRDSQLQQLRTSRAGTGGSTSSVAASPWQRGGFGAPSAGAGGSVGGFASAAAGRQLAGYGSTGSSAAGGRRL